MNRVNLPLLTTCTVAALACSGGDVKGSSSTVRDSAGIAIVENHTPLWTETERWRLSDEPVLQIGAVDGDDAYLFSQITGALRLSDGRIVVANGASRELRHRLPSGGFSRRPSVLGPSRRPTSGLRGCQSGGHVGSQPGYLNP